MPEVVATEELKLDLIRVVYDPNPLFKYQLIYRDGNATSMVGYTAMMKNGTTLYKQDTERYKVKGARTFEGIEPAFTYKQRKRRIDQPIIKNPLIVKSKSCRDWR